MNKVTIDPSLRSKLHNFNSLLELCDESGQTVGFFIPATEYQRLLYAWAHGQFTDEEIERARREPGGYTISEVLADLSD